jgi:chromosome segregation ATPase
MRAMKRELEVARNALEDAKQLRLRREETISSLKEETGKLKDDLKTARGSLENSTVPEVAELESLRREKEEALAARTKAEQSLENEKQLQEYLRSEYITASTRAMELAQANDDLQSRVDALEKKATGEAVRLKKLTMDNQTKSAFVEITRLEVQLKNVQKVLQRKEEELFKSKRTGIGTRAASVPRSPRVGPTTASRGGSPIPDRRVETLKNSNT